MARLSWGLHGDMVPHSQFSCTLKAGMIHPVLDRMRNGAEPLDIYIRRPEDAEVEASYDHDL